MLKALALVAILAASCSNLDNGENSLKIDDDGCPGLPDCPKKFTEPPVENVICPCPASFVEQGVVTFEDPLMGTCCKSPPNS